MKGYSSEELQNSVSGTKEKGGTAPLLMPKTRGERAVLGHGSPEVLAKVEDGAMKHGGMIGKCDNSGMKM